MSEAANAGSARMPDVDEILERMTAETGTPPRVMELLATLKPAMVAEQARSKQFANATDAIPEKYRQLIMVAAAAAARAPTCVKTQVAIALRQGATKEEIVDTLVLARFAVASTVFSNALGALEMLGDAEEGR